VQTKVQILMHFSEEGSIFPMFEKVVCDSYDCTNSNFPLQVFVIIALHNKHDDH